MGGDVPAGGNSVAIITRRYDLLRLRVRVFARHPVGLVLCGVAALIAAGFAKDALLLLLRENREIVALGHWVILRLSGDDSWEPMYRAVEQFARGTPRSIYQTIFFEQQIKFQYPPTSLLPFLALHQLGIERESSIRIMQALSTWSVGGLIWVSCLLARESVDRSVITFLREHRVGWLAIATVVLGTVSFYPIMYGHMLGQIQVIIDLAVCLALLCWRRQRTLTSGVLMAAAALIKPQYALVAVWALLRRETKFVAGFAALGLPVGLLALWVFGLREHLSYLETLSFIGQRGEVFWANQSMNGLLGRLVAQVDPLTWSAHSFAPFHRVAYVGTLLSSVVLMALGLVYRPRWVRARLVRSHEPSRWRESLLDFSTMILVLTMASPVAWEHHYGVTWPIFIIAFATMIGSSARGQAGITRWLLPLGVSYLLISNYFPPWRLLASPPWNLVYSYLFAGSALLLAMLVKLRSSLVSSRRALT